MEFKSFEEALAICVNAEEGSELQDMAAAYVIRHAPVELQERLVSVARKHFPHIDTQEDPHTPHTH